MSKKMVFAHLLTWFQTKEYSNKWEMWNSDYEGSYHNPDIILKNGKRDIASLTYPLIGEYDSNDPDVIEYQLLTMKLAGIDGVIVDWDGRKINQYRHNCFMKILPYIEKYNMKLVMCFEEWCGYWPISEMDTRQEQIERAIEEIRWLHENVLSLKQSFSIEGKIPLLVFRKVSTHWFNDNEWEFIKDATKSLNISYLFNDIYDEKIRDISDGYYTWVSGFDSNNENNLDFYKNEVKEYMTRIDKYAKDKIFFGSVMPGFDDSSVNGWGDGSRVAPRYNQKRYKQAWDFMNDLKVDFVQIVTWNDWNEGSQIEPDDLNGYKYLYETKKQIHRFKNQYNSEDYRKILELPYHLFNLRKANVNNGLVSLLSEAICNKQYIKAEHIIEYIKENEKC